MELMTATAIKIFLLKNDFIFIVYFFKLNIRNRCFCYRNKMFVETLHDVLLINDKRNVYLHIMWNMSTFAYLRYVSPHCGGYEVLS